MTPAGPRSARRRRDDAGLSMVVTLAGLVIVALLVLVGLKSTFGSGTSSGSSVRQPVSAGRRRPGAAVPGHRAHHRRHPHRGLRKLRGP